MRRALRLARRGQGRVEPNPMVGCVLVRGGRVIGEGYHRRFGGPHAEVEALRRCSGSPRGATAYVTLEPCCYYGKTPPCTDALLQAGVARVVAAVEDPNPRVAGKGLQQLRSAGVRVEVGLLREAATALNAPFFKLVQQRRPWVILKWAQSLDGKIATHTGDSKWITDEACRAHAHRVRGRMDAIVVGVGTVLADDPQLTCRIGRPRRVATRIVLDTRLRTPLTARLVQTATLTPTWLVHAAEASQRRAQRLATAGCRLICLPAAPQGVRLTALLAQLARDGLTNVLVEGGGRVLGAFLDQRLGDEAHVYVAPQLIGGSAAPGPWEGAGVARIAAATAFLKESVSVRHVGNGLLWVARLSRTSTPRAL